MRLNRRLGIVGVFSGHEVMMMHALALSESISLTIIPPHIMPDRAKESPSAVEAFKLCEHVLKFEESAAKAAKWDYIEPKTVPQYKRGQDEARFRHQVKSKLRKYKTRR